MSNFIYNAKQMREYSKPKQANILRLYKDINARLDEATNGQLNISVYLCGTSSYMGQWYYDNKEVKKVIKELKEDGYKVSDCEYYLVISW